MGYVFTTMIINIAQPCEENAESAFLLSTLYMIVIDIVGERHSVGFVLVG